ncbi:MAG: hypothetical protein IT548_18085 [Alphaproteobacteria bacterium]|nr:hypothetical protein [Alphaproteobacteria bacterium]
MQIREQIRFQPAYPSLEILRAILPAPWRVLESRAFKAASGENAVTVVADVEEADGTSAKDALGKALDDAQMRWYGDSGAKGDGPDGY